MRMRWFAALTAVFTLGGAVSAQPAKFEPTVEVRLRSIDDLINKAEYVAGLAGQEEVLKQVRGVIKQLSADGKGLEGIDTKRPFGLYVTLTQDVVGSQVTVMVPVAGQDRFLGLLKDRLGIEAEKGDDGTMKIAVPVVNELHLRFANDYVYVARSVKDLDPKALPTPKAYFAKDDGSVGSVLVRFDKIPDELKTFVIGQLELGVAEQRKKKGENESPAEKAALDWLAENFSGGVKTLLDDAKELNARIFIDEKTDDLSSELTLTAKSGTTLSKNIRGLGGKTSTPAAIVGTRDAVARGTARIGLPDGVKKDLGKVVDSAFEEILKKAGDNDKEPLGRLLKVIGPTLKAGELDAAVALTGPDAKGKHTLIAAAAVKGGKDVAQLLKDFAPHLGDKAEFDFDTEKVGDFAVHTVTLKGVPEKVEQIFGTKKVWLATSDDYIALSVEPDGAALKAGLKAKAVPVPVLSIDVAFAKVVPIIAGDANPDELKAILKDAFGDGPVTGKDALSITVTGGDQLTLKSKVKGKGVRLLASLLMSREGK